MQINIENRIIIITGPSTTGKTTLAKMIKESSPVQLAIFVFLVSLLLLFLAKLCITSLVWIKLPSEISIVLAFISIGNNTVNNIKLKNIFATIFCRIKTHPAYKMSLWL